MVESRMSATMKALVKREPGKGIWMQDVPVPTPGPNEVLVKVEKTAICGTDLHIYLWDEWSQRTIRPGLVIGHEFVGRIAELRSEEHTSELQSLMRTPYAVLFFKKKTSCRL